MAVKSYGFAAGAVRVLERNLLGPDGIERLIAAAGPMEAAKALQEIGYGRGEELSTAADYEGWLEKRAQELYAFVRGVSPETGVTDCFLLRIDYTNIKALYKARLLEEIPEQILREGGIFAVAVVTAVMRDQEYRQLTPAMQKALTALDAEAMAGPIDPRRIDTVLDKAQFEDIKERLGKVKSKAIVGYFADLADLTNLRSALRARAIGMNAQQLLQQLVTCGEVPPAKIETALEEPERAAQLFAGRPYKRLLDEAVAEYRQSGNLARYERFVDEHLLRLVKKGQWASQTAEPLIGYLLGVEREIAAIRLCMVGKINGFSEEAIRERLGELYG